MKDFLTRLLCLGGFIATPVFGGSVIINEIMYHPPGVPEETALEWIELHNTSTTNVNLSGWRFTKGINYVVPNGMVIPPGGYLVFGANVGRLEEYYPELPVVLGPW